MRFTRLWMVLSFGIALPAVGPGCSTDTSGLGPINSGRSGAGGALISGGSGGTATHASGGAESGGSDGSGGVTGSGGGSGGDVGSGGSSTGGGVMGSGGAGMGASGGRGASGGGGMAGVGSGGLGTGGEGTGGQRGTGGQLGTGGLLGTGGAGTGGAAGSAGTGGLVGTGGTVGSPECVRASDCRLVSDCCTCGAQPAGGPDPRACKLDCAQSKCAQQMLPPNAVDCVAGRCVAGFNCDATRVVCGSSTPTCGAGEVPTVNAAGTCFMGGCVPATQCKRVTSCAACRGAEQACVNDVTSQGNQAHCVTVPSECSGAASCACLGPSSCVSPYNVCVDFSGIRGIACGCPNC